MPATRLVPDEGLLKLPDVLRLLNVSRTVLWKIRARGQLPSVYVGRALRFRRRDVEHYIRLRTAKSIPLVSSSKGVGQSGNPSNRKSKIQNRRSHASSTG